MAIHCRYAMLMAVACIAALGLLSFLAMRCIPTIDVRVTRHPRCIRGSSAATAAVVDGRSTGAICERHRSLPRRQAALLRGRDPLRGCFRRRPAVLPLGRASISRLSSAGYASLELRSRFASRCSSAMTSPGSKISDTTLEASSRPPSQRTRPVARSSTSNPDHGLLLRQHDLHRPEVFGDWAKAANVVLEPFGISEGIPYVLRSAA